MRQELCKAIDSRDLTALKRIIEEKKIQKEALDQFEILYYIIGQEYLAEKTRYDMAQFLLHRGVSVEGPEFEWRRWDNTPLIKAAELGCRTIVELLLDKGARIDRAVDERGTALLVAAAHGKQEVVELLIDRKAKTDYTASDGATVLSEAVESGDLDLVRFLLTKGFAIDSVDKYGRTLLFNAVNSENPEMVEFLLKEGIDIKHVDDRKETVLFAAIRFKNLEIVKLLLKHGVNVNHMNCVKYVDNDDIEERVSVLFLAAARNELEVVRLLLDAGADIHQVNHFRDYRLTALFQAIRSHSLAVVRMLMKRGINVCEEDGSGRTPLFWAVRYGADEIAKFLLQQGAPLDAKDKEQSILEYAIEEYRRRGVSSIVKLLILSGAATLKDGKDLLADFPGLQDYRNELYKKIRALLKTSFDIETASDNFIRFILQAAPKIYHWKQRLLNIRSSLVKVIEALPADQIGPFFFAKIWVALLRAQVDLLKFDKFDLLKTADNLHQTILKKLLIETAHREGYNLHQGPIVYAKALSVRAENYLIKKLKEDAETEKVLSEKNKAKNSAEKEISKNWVLDKTYTLPLEIFEIIAWLGWLDYLKPCLESMISEECKPYLTKWFPVLASAEGKPNDFEVWLQEGCKLDTGIDPELDSVYSYDTGDESFSSEEDEFAYSEENYVPEAVVGFYSQPSHVFENEANDSDWESYESDRSSLVL